MQTVIGRHKVDVIDVLLKAQQERVDIFKQAGASFRTFQDAGDPNSVLLLIETEDPGNLAAIINDPANAAMKAAHTVIEPVIISMGLIPDISQVRGPFGFRSWSA